MSTPENQQARIERIFFPHMQAKEREVRDSGCRFIYYTTADVATEILKKRKVWMRNASMMNDYSEVSHGLKCLQNAYANNGPLARILASLDSCFAGFADEMLKFFNGWAPEILSGTYITCLSLYSQKDDKHGRLSMWRAYGGSAGVGLVLKGEIMLAETHTLRAYAYPVQYTEAPGIASHLDEIAKSVEGNIGFIKTLDRETIKNSVFSMLRSVAVCTKHPAFEEEKEWRVVAAPRMYPSKYLEQSVEVVRGIPQVVIKIELENHPADKLLRLSIADLLDHIIIGPCAAPKEIQRAFTKLLVDANIPEADAQKKVIFSEIPLRPSV
jgi:hypothetical protein